MGHSDDHASGWGVAVEYQFWCLRDLTKQRLDVLAKEPPTSVALNSAMTAMLARIPPLPPDADAPHPTFGWHVDPANVPESHVAVGTAIDAPVVPAGL